MQQSQDIFIRELRAKGFLSSTKWLKKKKKNPPANARDIRDTDLIPGLGRSLGGEHSKPLRYSCLETEKPGRLLSIESHHKELDVTVVT